MEKINWTKAEETAYKSLKNKRNGYIAANPSSKIAISEAFAAIRARSARPKVHRMA